MLDDDTGIGEADFPFPPLPRTFDFIVPGCSAAFTGRTVQARPFGAAAGFGDAASRIKALCIGINEYRGASAGRLCQRRARVGRRRPGAARRRGGLSARRRCYLRRHEGGDSRLCRAATPGDVLVLQYAGHGGQLPNRVDTEEDGFNEALDSRRLPYRGAARGRRARRDPERPAGRRHMTLFMDCCHSGTNSRFAPVIRARAALGDKPAVHAARRRHRRRVFLHGAARAPSSGARTCRCQALSTSPPARIMSSLGSRMVRATSPARPLGAGQRGAES